MARILREILSLASVSGAVLFVIIWAPVLAALSQGAN